MIKTEFYEQYVNDIQICEKNDKIMGGKLKNGE